MILLKITKKLMSTFFEIFVDKCEAYRYGHYECFFIFFLLCIIKPLVII